MVRGSAPESNPEKVVSIQNVGGIADLTVTLKPGVNVLIGRNGSGKSSAIRAVSRAFGGEVPLEPRDGTQRGIVRTDGVELSVKRVVKQTGEAEVALADPGPLAALIDPGLKDSDAAARRRIQALLQMVHVPVDDAAVATLAGDQEIRDLALRELHEHSIDHILEAAERVRYLTHEHARAAESEAQRLRAEAEAHRQHAATVIGELGGQERLVDIPADQAEATRAAAETAAAAARIGAQQRAELEERQASIRTTIGEAPDPARYDQDLEIRRDSLRAADERLRTLELQIAKERETMAGIREDLKHLEAARKRTLEDAERHAEQLAILKQPITGPTAADVALQEEERDHARDIAARASKSHAYRVQHRLEAEKAHAAGEAADRAKILRELATTVHHRLGLLLRGTEAEGLTIVDGRLHVMEGGEIYDYEHRRSEGQRIDAALAVAARTYRGKAIALDGRLWSALDPTHRKAFAAKAADLGLYVITEQPADAEIHVEHLATEPLVAVGGVA